MSTQAIERNYTKNPHTARFLQTFHSAIGSNGRNYRAELDENAAERELAAQDDDLLNSVPVGQGFTPSDAQVKLISKLILEIHALDAELGSKAASYTATMDRNGSWTRENTTRWIGNMIQKSRELRAAKTTTSASVAVEDGRYAVEEDGELHFFKVKNGRKAGFVFLDIQASDGWYSIRNLSRIRTVLALIAQDPKGAMARYGIEIGECGRCGRVLTSEYRKLGIGPICQKK